MKKAIIWMRRDLRFNDNMAMSAATHSCDEVYPVFIFDKNIIDNLSDRADKRINFIFNTLQVLGKQHKIHVFYGDPIDLIPSIAEKFGVQAVYTNEDYENYAITRDNKVAQKLTKKNIEFNSFKDTVIFNYKEIKNGQGLPYKVFTPYKNKWLYELEINPDAYADKKILTQKFSINPSSLDSEVKTIADIGFESIPLEGILEEDPYLIMKNFKEKIDQYDKQRDFPAIEGTSRLSVHLRFGTIGARELIRIGMPFNTQGKKVWLSELVWRDFYFAVLGNFPHVEKKAFLPYFENLPWENNQKLFQAWCEGKTGVAIVDAGMRQLNETGWMHNRLRMIVASYLCKTLLIDWRWGERYFADKLLDFDLAANNGGWQWSASTGCDAAPYFRIFNPESQAKKFDPSGEFVRQYAPDCSLKPVVDYKARRIKALNIYKKTKEEYGEKNE